MCPLWPLHWIQMHLLVLGLLWLVSCVAAEAAASWSVKFTPELVKGLQEGQTVTLGFTTQDLSPQDLAKGQAEVFVEDPLIVSASKTYTLRSESIHGADWSSAFNLTGNFLGYTTVRLRLSTNNSEGKAVMRESDPVKVTVIRKPSVMDRIFISSVIALVSIIFINFGCALDIALLKRALVKPVGPLIALSCHYFFLPLISYGLGLLLFPNSMVLRLGLFFTGVSPAGGASNIWTVTLGGNLNLSVTMTAFSTLASFFMIPLWHFTLGQLIFSGGSIAIPYARILTSAVGLILPLAIGYGIQIYFKNFSNVMVKILKPFSVIIIIFIVVFATVTNFYLFKLFTWRILLSGLAIPTLGYFCGWVMGTLTKQSPEDVLAIAIESCVQNTGIPIFLLRLCLEQPEADLTTVAPVAVSLMTPIPVLILYVVRRFCCNMKKQVKAPTKDKEIGIVDVSTSPIFDQT